MYGTFFLVKNPNGKFSVTNHAESVAQQMADENGSEFWEIVDPDDASLEVTLKKAALEAGAEKVAAVEIKTLMVDGEPVKVQTSTQAEKQRILDEAEAAAEAEAASEEEEPEPE